MNEDVLDKNIGQPLYKSVIILGIDGAGAYFKNLNLPNINKIFNDGNIVYNMSSIVPTSSAQNWGSMFYGTTPQEHRLVNQVVSHRRVVNEKLPSVFKMINQKYPNEKIACFCGWSPICTGIVDQTEGVCFYPETQKDSSLTNEEVLNYATTYLNQYVPRFCFIQLDELDEVGHEYGWGSDIYNAKAFEIDAQIGEFYKQVEQIENCLFILTTDHGGKGKRHGGDSKEEIECLFAIRGDEIKKNSEILDFETRDIASIILYALGIEQPENYTSRIPGGIWDNIGGGQRPVSKLSCSTNSEYYRSHSGDASKDLSPVLKEKILYEENFDAESESLGYYGNALDCMKTYVVSDFVWQDEDKISISFWIKANKSDGDPVIIANKNWQSGRNPGFAIIQKDRDIIFNIGDGNKHRVDISFPIPDDYYEGWTNYVFIIDSIEKSITGYCDFEYLFTHFVTTEDFDFNKVKTDFSLVIGQDVTGNYDVALNALLDDVIIFNDCLTNNEILILKDYYTDFN